MPVERVELAAKLTYLFRGSKTVTVIVTIATGNTRILSRGIGS
jgi:hypothetical protein